MMLSLRYALADLRGTFTSFRIVLACLILGVGAIATVFITGSSILGSINDNGRTILGGDIVIRSQTPPSQNLIDFLNTQNVRLSHTIESRVMMASSATSDSALVELKAVDDVYPLFDKLTTDQNIDKNILLQNHGILLDPSLGARLNLKVGDAVQLGQHEFTLRGFIVSEPDRAGGSRFGFAPRAMISRDNLQDTGFLNYGSMVNYDLRIALDNPQDFKSFRDALKAKFPNENWRITDTDNASPQVTNFVNRLMLFLSLVGLSTLLIGGVGINAGMRAHFETRLRTIAIFQSLGAKRGFITQIYLWQALIIVFIGTFFGLALGLTAPFIILPFLKSLLPFAVEPSITVTSILIPSLFGILTGFVFALWPLGQAIATSPLVLFRSQALALTQRPPKIFIFFIGALASALIGLALLSAHDSTFALWFILGAFSCFIIFASIGKLISLSAKKIKSPNDPARRLALRNLGRTGNATSFTLVSLGLGLTVLMTITAMELNLRGAITERLPQDAPAFFFLDIQPDQKDAFVSLLEQQPTAHTLKLSPNLRGRIVSINGVPAADALKDKSESWLLQNDRGFTYTSELPSHSTITSGAWWPQNYSGPPLVSVVDDVERGFGVKVGDEITVNILGRDITAKIANIRDVDWTNFTINFAITFAPSTLESAPHSWLATIVADPKAETDIQRAVIKAFPNITMVRVSDAVKTATDIMANIAMAVRVGAIVAIVTGLLVLAGTLAATRNARLYDTVILKVLGTRSRTLLKAFFLEFGFLGLTASILSLVLGSILSWAVMVHIMDLTWVFYPIPAIVTGLIGVTLVLLMGWAITGRVLSAPAAPHLRND